MSPYTSVYAEHIVHQQGSKVVNRTVWTIRYYLIEISNVEICIYVIAVYYITIISSCWLLVLLLILKGSVKYVPVCLADLE